MSDWFSSFPRSMEDLRRQLKLVEKRRWRSFFKLIKKKIPVSQEIIWGQYEHFSWLCRRLKGFPSGWKNRSRFHEYPEGSIIVPLWEIFFTYLKYIEFRCFPAWYLHFLAWSCKNKFSYWLIGTPSRISTWKNVSMHQPQKKRYCDNFTEVNILKDKSGSSTSMELFETLSTPAPLWNKC